MSSLMSTENVIYKFLPPERISYLQDELLRITQPGDLNDPFECLPFPASQEETIGIIEGLLAANIEKIKISKIPKTQKKEEINLLESVYKANITGVRKNKPGNLRDQYYKESVAKINAALGILSLTRRWDSTLMWSHYANSHKGFCIGLNIDDAFFKEYRDKLTGEIMFMAVQYADERIKVPMGKDERIDPFVMLRKSPDWKYEEEERLLVGLKKASKRIQKKPFDIYLYKVPHSLIKEIIAGANISDSDLNEIKRFCKEKNIVLYQSKISEFKFDMTRISI